MYSTQSDIENRIGSNRLIQLTDLDGDGSADSVVVTAAIEKADAQIDSYLRTRYSLPMSAVPTVVRELSVDLAVYALHQTRRETMSDRDHESYEDAIEFLKNVAAGLADIDLDFPEDSAEQRDTAQLTTPRDTHDPVFREKENGTSNLDNF